MIGAGVFTTSGVCAIAGLGTLGIVMPRGRSRVFAIAGGRSADGQLALRFVDPTTAAEYWFLSRIRSPAAGFIAGMGAVLTGSRRRARLAALRSKTYAR